MESDDDSHPSEPTWQIEVHPQILGTHQWSFFAGFAQLVGTQRVSLRFRTLRPTQGMWLLTTRVTHVPSRTVKVIGWEMGDAGALDSWHARHADAIVKRGYDPDNSSEFEAAAGDVVPLGLTLGVRSPGSNRLAMRSTLHLARHRALVRDVGFKSVASSMATVARTAVADITGRHDQLVQESESSLVQLGERYCDLDDPYVTFLVRAWDPQSMNPHLADNLREVTSERARLIRRLRSELGPRFVGGFVPSDYVARTFEDCIADVPTRRPDFLEQVTRGGVAISTVGVAGSNPWKLAEYAALGSAIISEPLQQRLPVPLVEDQNVVWFRTTDQCVEQCRRVLDDADLRQRLRSGSRSYWASECQPATLIENRLADVFGLT